MAAGLLKFVSVCDRWRAYLEDLGRGYALVTEEFYQLSDEDVSEEADQ